MKKYTEKEKCKYYDSKADDIAKRYKLDSSKVMAYSNLLITNDDKKYNKIKKTINSKDYKNDMYRLLYYQARSVGDDHNTANKFAKENVRSMCYGRIVHVRDVANILKGYEIKD